MCISRGVQILIINIDDASPTSKGQTGHVDRFWRIGPVDLSRKTKLIL